MTGQYLQFVDDPIVQFLVITKGKKQVVRFSFMNVTKTECDYLVWINLGKYSKSPYKFEEYGEKVLIDPGIKATPGKVISHYLQFEIPDLDEITAGDYNLKVTLIPLKNGLLYGNLVVGLTLPFEIKTLSNDCRMFYFFLVTSPAFTYTTIVTDPVAGPDGTNTIQATVANEISLSSAKAVFVVSPGATAKIGDTVQVSGSTENDYSTEVIFRVIAEDGVAYRNYVVTITKKGTGTARIIVWEGANTRCSPGVLKFNYFNRLVRIFAEVSPALAGGDYDPSEEQELFVYLYRDSKYTQIATIPLDREMLTVSGGYNYYVFEGRWIIDPDFEFTEGEEITLRICSQTYHLAYGSYYADVSFIIKRYYPVAVALSFSEKLGVFQGERECKSQFMTSINNDLYSLETAAFDSKDKFYLEDYIKDGEASTEHFGNELEWELEFDVNSAFSSVIFQSLGIEMGDVSGETEDVSKPTKISYQTTQHSVLQDPFYDDGAYPVTGIRYEWENPWQPVRKNERWYLSIKNAYIEDALIKNQKLKGTWLRVGLFGLHQTRFYIRSVITKIAKIFN